jgi:hypothetical protein
MPSQFEILSGLRQHEALNRKLRNQGVIHQAHVVAYAAAFPTAWLRAMKLCRRCGRVLRAAEWPHDRSGTNLKHCGCKRRDPLVSPREGTSKYAIKAADKNEYKRMARAMALPGFKPSKHQSHVFAYRAHVAAVERQQRLERYKAWLERVTKARCSETSSLLSGGMKKRNRLRC